MTSGQLWPGVWTLTVRGGSPPLDSCKFVCLKDLLVDKVGKIL